MSLRVRTSDSPTFHMTKENNVYNRMTVAVTGHRPDKLNNEWEMNGPVSKKIYDKLALLVTELKTTKMITGMALGVDILFANVAINKNIPFTCAIPCIGQETKWPEKSQKLYKRIVTDKLSTKYFVSNKPYNHQCMQKRNEWMVDNCDVLIAVWDGTEGGTYNCIKYAILKGKEIVRINPKEL